MARAPEWTYHNLAPAPAYFQNPHGGALLPSEMWNRFSQQVAMDLAESYRNTVQELKGKGVPFVSTGMFRDYKTQSRLQRAKPTLAADPGTSWHEAGRAIDLNLNVMLKYISYPDLKVIMAGHGWFTLPWVDSRDDSEAWHFQHITRRVGGAWSPWPGGVGEAISWVRSQR